MMTRKDFEEIVRIVNVYIAQNGLEETAQELAEHLGDYFKTQNPNFNMALFKQACVRGENEFRK